MDIRENVTMKIAEVLELKEKHIQNDDDLLQYGLDSLKLIQLVVQLESIFEIEIDDNELLIENFCTLEKVINSVKKNMNYSN